jgi:heptaprenyl diphosphate synthase
MELNVDKFIRDKNYIEVKKSVAMALFIAMAICLSVIEAFIPINFVIPGVKLGLANIILVILLYHYNFKQLLMFQFLRITITSFILGIFSVYLFAMTAGFFSLIVMFILVKIFKNKISIYIVSMCGAITHNVIQVMVAIVFMRTPELVYYIPYVIIFGVITGFINGYIITKLKPSISGVIDNDTHQKFFK